MHARSATLPGSTFLFLWQQDRGGMAPGLEPVRAANLVDALQADGENYLGVKIACWIPLL